MNTIDRPKPAPQSGKALPAQPAAVCRPVFPQKLPDWMGNMPKSDLSYLPFLTGQTTQGLIASLRAAPQFSGLPLTKLFRQRRSGLRVIFLAESPYYAQQAALYLATLSDLERRQNAPAEKQDSFWDDTGLGEIVDTETPENPLKDALVIASAALLDPALNADGHSEMMIVQTTGAEELAQPMTLDALHTHAILLAAAGGKALSARVLDVLDDLLDRDFEENPLDLFLTLTPRQMDREYLEELRFRRGFHICRVGTPDEAYLGRFLLGTIEEQTGVAAARLDTAAVIAGVRRYRRGRFDERDLIDLVRWAVQRGAALPLTEKDLQMTPFAEEEKSGWEELKSMVGLENVKQELRRRLAAAALEDRRRQKGLNPPPMYRSMAFAGPPGSGKSVTARLAARILCEEGCGTGRFVEAGREQLIGRYLGHTSPMVAKLFEEARGGVLFIDEAGALLEGSGGDTYAAEAVNALVRHMELEPQTTVIFATYPDEMERLLSANPGLSSRVAQVLRFDGYDDDTLWRIFQGFAQKGGDALPEGAEAAAKQFFAALRTQKGDAFGNGREARRLYQAAVDELAPRVLEGAPDALTLADLTAAADRLLVLPNERKTKSIGF